MTQDDPKETIAKFKDAVNMAPKSLEEWLETDESRAVGQKDENRTESTGHATGRRIVTILRKKRADYTDADVAHMREVTGYIHRHLAQRPEGDISDTA